jgi:hypothetical protein
VELDEQRRRFEAAALAGPCPSLKPCWKRTATSFSFKAPKAFLFPDASRAPAPAL